MAPRFVQAYTNLGIAFDVKGDHQSALDAFKQAIDAGGGWKGDTVTEVLNYVQYSAEKLTDRMRKDVEKAVKHSRITATEARQFLRFYETGLEGYTYLEEPSA